MKPWSNMRQWFVMLRDGRCAARKDIYSGPRPVIFRTRAAVCQWIARQEAKR